MQKHKALRFKVFLPLVALLLTACPNIGGGPPPPSSIKLTVEDPGGSFVAAAYQVGTGDWQALNMTGTTTKTATIPMNNETKYGVAVRCGNEVKVIQATSGELANPKIVCSRTNPSTVSFTVDVEITGIQVESGDKVCVNYNFLEDNSQWCSPITQTGGGASATVNVSDAPAVSGGRDLLITLREGTDPGWVKVAKVVRNRQVQGGGPIQVTLTSDDNTNLSAPLTVPSSASAPSGYEYLPAAIISYGSANGTASGSVNASFTQYRPVSGFEDGDLYGALILASHPNAELMSIQLFRSGAPRLEFPAPWDDNGLTVTPVPHPTVGGLSREENDLKGYEISLSSSLSYTASLSKGWLGNETSYRLPDLSSLLGYTALQNGDLAYIGVVALLSNKTVLTTSFFDNAVPSDLEAGDYFKIAEAHTSFTVGESDSNPISFPQP